MKKNSTSLKTINIPGLSYIAETFPEEILDRWEARELGFQKDGKSIGWDQVAQEKGWNTWRQWRQFTMDQFNGAERQWSVYQMTDPNTLIPHMRVGPTQSWQNHFQENGMATNTHSFYDLVRTKTEWIQNHGRIRDIRDNFPTSTEFIGFYLPHKNIIVCFEGHHRAAAVAFADYEQRPLQFQENPTIALTVIVEEEEYIFDAMLQQGSHNPQKKTTS